MKKKGFIGCLFLAAYVPIPGCFHEQLTYYMPQDFKDYVVFPVGSYWVYEEMYSHEIDTVRLATVHIDVVGDRAFGDYEHLTGRLEGTRGTTAITIQARTGEDGKIGYRYYAHTGGAWPGPVEFFDANEVGQSLTDLASEIELTYSHHYETIDIHKVTRYDVRVFEHNKADGTRKVRSTYYARYIGVVRTELFNGQMWELKDFFINN